MCARSKNLTFWTIGVRKMPSVAGQNGKVPGEWSIEDSFSGSEGSRKRGKKRKNKVEKSPQPTGILA
jgi:hypothetical protein